MNKLKNYIHEGLHNHESKYFIQFNVILAAITLLSVLSIVLETVASLRNFVPIFHVIEWFSVIFFSFEYLVRLWTVEKKLRYILSFWGIVDILAIAPTYLGLGNWTFLKSTRILRILRLLRLLRLIKVVHIYAETVHSQDSQQKINRQNIKMYFFTLATSVLMAGSILYAAEHTQEAYKDIPSAMVQGAKILVGGLAIAQPQTLPGELLVIAIRFIGLALFGLLIAIIGSTLHELIFGEQPVKK